jgi:hypothetical protein
LLRCHGPLSLKFFLQSNLIKHFLADTG